MNVLDDDRLSNSSNDSDNDNDNDNDNENDRIDRDNDADEAMEDVDDNGDQDQDAEGDDDDNNDDDDDDDDENGDANDDGDGDADGDGDGDESQPPATNSNDQTSAHVRTEPNGDTERESTTPSPSSHRKWPQPRPGVINARLYDIVPTMAAPQSTSVNAMAITPDLRYWITGGSDGYIRKYDGPNTINGKLPLTVAQRHPFVDSVTKAGILMSYWENEEPAPPGRGDQEHILSPVYSLAVHSEALWLLSGLESGGIN
ncbi:unnamed protein product, partial [Fusarium graminearum]